jgi:hypothetical protein
MDLSRRTAWAGVLVAVLCAGCGKPSGSTHGSTDGSGASCIAPYLDDQPPGGRYGAPEPTVAAGTSLTVYGHWYTSTCNDAGQGDPVRALPPVHVSLTLPGGAAREVGTFSPSGQDLGFSFRIHVPADTPPGTATLHDDQEHPATYAFEVSGS